MTKRMLDVFARVVRRASIATCMALWMAAAGHAAGPRGFIVELKNAVPHGEPAREMALQADRIDAAALQRERLQRCLLYTSDAADE